MLFVCTGNACRSAFAELLARRLMADRLGPAAPDLFGFTSAGVRADPGRPIHPGTRAALAVWGISAGRDGPDAFRTRRLDEKMIAGADLVLAAEESHRSAIAWMAGDAVPKVYGMRRFARMLRMLDQRRLPADPVHRALLILEWAPALHAGLGPVPPDDEVVPDPVDGGPWEHLRTADLVADVVGTLVDVLAPAPVPPPTVRTWR